MSDRCILKKHIAHTYVRLGELRDINIESVRLGASGRFPRCRYDQAANLRGGPMARREERVPYSQHQRLFLPNPGRKPSPSPMRGRLHGGGRRPPLTHERLAGGLGMGVPTKARMHLATPSADPAIPRLPRGNARGPYFIYPKRTPTVVISRNPHGRNIRQKEARALRIRLAPYSPRPRPFPQVRRLVLTTPRKPARNTQYLPQGEGFRY